MSHPISPVSNLPKHVAIIMDGNGRWARAKGLPRTMGHKRGAETVKRIVEHAGKIGIEYLTLFGFSSENWRRPEDEVRDLMKLLRQYLRSQTAELHKNNVRMSVIGNRDAFDDDIVDLIENAEDLTRSNTGIHVVIALNYGGRNDIATACSKMMEEAAQNGETLKVDDIEARMSAYLMTADMPEPDLLIRTSGETRISNFLLWQCAYSEMVFTPVLWPDFTADDFDRAITDYSARDRRFGALSKRAETH